MENLIPEDLSIIAKARGFKLETKAGDIIVKHKQRVRLQTRDIGRLRAWLMSSQSLMIRTI